MGRLGIASHLHKQPSNFSKQPTIPLVRLLIQVKPALFSFIEHIVIRRLGPQNLIDFDELGHISSQFPRALRPSSIETITTKDLCKRIVPSFIPIQNAIVCYSVSKTITILVEYRLRTSSLGRFQTIRTSPFPSRSGPSRTPFYNFTLVTTHTTRYFTVLCQSQDGFSTAQARRLRTYRSHTRPLWSSHRCHFIIDS